MRRDKLIQLIHIASSKTKVCSACSRLHFCDECPSCQTTAFKAFSKEAYRDLLKTLTGKTSCKKLSDFELEKVYEVFEKAGFKPTSNKPQVLQEIDRGNRGTLRLIFARGKEVLGPSYERRINGFVKMKFKGRSIYKLSKNELRSVIGWINRMSKSNNK